MLIFFLKILLHDNFAFQSLRGLLALAVFGWYVWLCLSYFRYRWAERRLLVDSCFANGVVIEQGEVWHSLPRITYRFRNETGQDFQNKVTDFSRRLYEDMPVSVFYDEHDPSQSTTLESSVFLIV